MLLFQIDKVAPTEIANKQHTFPNICPLGISNRLHRSRTAHKSREHNLMHAPCTKPPISFGHLPSTWTIQRYKGVWNGLTFVLLLPIHSELTVFLCSTNMLLSLACLWTLSHNVSAAQFWWIISSCTRLTAGHTHAWVLPLAWVGSCHTGAGRTPAPLHPATCSPVLLTWNCACKNALTLHGHSEVLLVAVSSNNSCSHLHMIRIIKAIP